jgi:hypothetical protein
VGVLEEVLYQKTKKGVFLGALNVRSLYTTGSLTAAARELSSGS